MAFNMMFKTFKCADTNQKQPLEGLHKKRALKSFARFRGKCLCQGLFFLQLLRDSGAGSFATFLRTLFNKIPPGYCF